MAETTLLARIVVSRNVMHGKPRIAGTRILVMQVLDLLAAGKSVSEVLSEDYFPDLTEADVRACLAYSKLDTPTEEEILASFRQGLQDAFTGNYRPARDVLAELKSDSDD
jgi:uncharacterized protein (DUF433 family)